MLAAFVPCLFILGMRLVLGASYMLPCKPHNNLVMLGSIISLLHLRNGEQGS